METYICNDPRHGEPCVSYPDRICFACKDECDPNYWVVVSSGIPEEK